MLAALANGEAAGPDIWPNAGLLNVDIIALVPAEANGNATKLFVCPKLGRPNAGVALPIALEVANGEAAGPVGLPNVGCPSDGFAACPNELWLNPGVGCAVIPNGEGAGADWPNAGVDCKGWPKVEVNFDGVVNADTILVGAPKVDGKVGTPNGAGLFDYHGQYCGTRRRRITWLSTCPKTDTEAAWLAFSPGV